VVSPIHPLERLLSEEEIVKRLTQFAPTLLPVLVPDENAVGAGMVHHGVGNHQVPLVVIIVPRSHAVEFPVPVK